MITRTHAEQVLSAIVDKKKPRSDLLATAIARLEPEHFGDQAHRVIYKTLVRYFDITGNVISREAFLKSLQDSDLEETKVLSFIKTYDALSSISVPDADFEWSIEGLKEEQLKKQTGELVVTAAEILRNGYDVGKERLSGARDALAYLTRRVPEIDRLHVNEPPPEGNIFEDGDDILSAYESAKAGENGSAVLSGIGKVDSAIQGYQRGELITICGFRGTGKSQVVAQNAWHAAVKEGKNVFFATSETLRHQVMRRIIARHSKEMFPDSPIDSAEIKKGILSEKGERVLREVIDDWKNNSSYGNLHVAQIPSHATLGYVERKLTEYGKEFDTSLCVIDYIALLDSNVRRGSRREELNEIIVGTKLMAQSFDNGRGVPVVTPWQMRRESYEQALRQGFYLGASLSETAEAENSSDTIMAFLREEGTTDANHQMKLQFLKLRDDEIPPIDEVAIDFRYSYIGAHNTPALSNPNSGHSLVDLLDGIG